MLSDGEILRIWGGRRVEEGLNNNVGWGNVVNRRS